MNVRKATPPEIDARLAELAGFVMTCRQHERWALDSMHTAAGDRQRYVTKSRQEWTKFTDAEMLRHLYDATVPEGMTAWKARQWESAVTEYIAAYEQRMTHEIETDKLEDEYVRRGGWSRFFIVRNNNGHIHSTRNCSTCYATTQFGWLPQLSGLSEKDAVEAHGTILCSVCFPSAPVEWTVGKQTDDTDVCPGSGQKPADEAYGRRYRKCAGCGSLQSVTASVRIRKHKTPKESK